MWTDPVDDLGHDLRVASRAAAVAGSKTSAMRNAAEALRAQGRKIVNFAAGELDLTPPEELREALRDAAGKDVHRYTATAGVPELRQALAGRISRLSGVRYDAAEVMLTTGAKHGLYLACLALLEPGDEVLIPYPAWGTLVAQVRLAGGVPIPVPTSGPDFVPGAEDLARVSSPRTRMVIINTPNNPTGAVYDPPRLADIVSWAGQNRLWLLLDECYGELVFPGVHHEHPAMLREDARERTVVVGSFSKTFAVTGWRAGYVYGPAPVVSTMSNIQSHTTSHVSSVVQHALLPAARGELDWFVADTRRLLLRRRDAVRMALDEVPHLQAATPQGGFYFFIDFRTILGRTVRNTPVRDTEGLAAALLESAGVALTAGTAFGVEGFLRLSFAIGDDDLGVGLAALQAAVSEC